MKLGETCKHGQLARQCDICNLEKEVQRLEKCCTQRGARMQLMRESMRLVDWHNFTVDYPEANNWFDEDGVAK